MNLLDPEAPTPCEWCGTPTDNFNEDEYGSKLCKYCYEHKLEQGTEDELAGSSSKTSDD